ncbi:cytochrome P450 [Rhodococcus jostii]|uniref:cytochrome P450 n=1 Tax=Rhodococcus jostii TaxID=132919 RepID=UPI0036416277
MSIESATDGELLKITEPGFSAMGEEIRAARERNWYARTNYGLAVLRHSEVGALLKDRRLRQGSWSWPAQNGITEGVLSDWWKNSLVGMEGEDHARIRKLVNPAFSHSVIATMTDSFRELAHDIIDQFADSGMCEFMTDFAEPYSSRALSRLLDLPEEDWRELTRLAADMGLAFGPEIVEQRARIEAAILDLYARADELVAQRRVHPTDDFVSALVTATDEAGDRLSDLELRELIASLIFGGMDTTRSQIGLMMQTFVEHPDQWALLADRPELAAQAVEEVIRFNPAIHWTTRMAIEDFSFRGVDIPEGTVIHLLSYSAGTDPLAVGDANFDITVKRAPHFGFGGGRHHCLGHFVARLDIREALQALSQRVTRPRFSAPPSYRPPTGNTGPIVLPVSFVPVQSN